MNDASYSACRIANKVSMHMRYVATTGDTQSARPIIEEAFLLTLQLFQQSDLDTAQADYRQQHKVFIEIGDDASSVPAAWSQWNADACQELRTMGFQEKPIAALGDEMSRWNIEAVDPETLNRSLAGLATACSSEASATVNAILTRETAESNEKSQLDSFSMAVCGLAILLASLASPTLDDISKAASGVPMRAALTCFGAHLLASGTGTLG